MTGKILEIEDVTVSFGGFKAINHLNFNLDYGELRVIIGPNGAGKTTFLDTITGKVQPTEGRVLFKGRNLRDISEYAIARMGIGRKFQTPRVYLNLTVKENLDLACNQNKNVLSTLFRRPESSEYRKVGSLLETIGLVTRADLPAALLSHGEKQRLEIGMLVAQSPDLLLVDEPVAGLTDEETENVGNLLLALAESHAIIVIEHDMEFVRQIARQVTVLHQGSVLCEGTMDQIQNDPKVIEVYLGQQPSITSHQLKILRVIGAMALADGHLESAEMDLMLSRLSQVFAHDVDEQNKLKEELKVYLYQDVSVDHFIDELTEKEKELVLRLSYEVISISSRHPDEPNINSDERAAYREMVALLNLPLGKIQEIEVEVREKLNRVKL